MPELTLVALGGNALIRPGERGTLQEQAHNLRRSLLVVLELVRRGEHVAITHGNGPQVGHIVLRAEAARGRAYDVPLDFCVAQSQGEMGYLISQELRNLLARAGVRRDVAAVVTRTLVRRDDPRMREPVKPIGPAMTAEEASQLAERGLAVAGDRSTHFRRVVPSPEPREILEVETIRVLVAGGAIVIAAGGGGIPVAETPEGNLVGVEAVVDKDLTGGMLATALAARRIIDLTAVDHAKLDFGTERERDLEIVTAAEARRYLGEGHFGPGTMQPKIEAAARFIEHGGREFIITTPERALAALEGGAATRVVAGDADGRPSPSAS